MKSFKYLILYLVIIELIIPICFTLHVGYNERMNYPLIKDNPANIDVILDQIKKKIDQEQIEDYIIILGDSVAYSGPGPAKESIGHNLEQYLNEHGQKTTVFNFSMPAMQVGDIYTMLLKLDQHKISTDKLIFNVIYAGFAERQPDPPIVFWLDEDLSKLDHIAFEQFKPELNANKCKTAITFPDMINNIITNNLNIFVYKDFIKADMTNRINTIRGIPENDTIGDNRPWYEKEGLKKLLQSPEYQKGFTTDAFDLSMDNPQIYFLDKISSHQKGKKTLVFMGPVNPELMEQVNDPGYQHNLMQINNYFSENSWQYIDFHGQLSPSLFTDHVHMTAPGYQAMAERLAEYFVTGDRSK